MVTLSMIGESLTGREGARNRRSVFTGPAREAAKHAARKIACHHDVDGGMMNRAFS
jgi:hypothetical protein